MDLKQEIESAPISETCDNNVDDNTDGMIATVSDEGCAPTTTNANAIITDTTNSDTNANTTDTTNSDTNTNTTDTTNSDTNTNTTDTVQIVILIPIPLTVIQILIPIPLTLIQIQMQLLHHQHLKHVTLVQTIVPDGTIAPTSNEGCTLLLRHRSLILAAVA